MEKNNSFRHCSWITNKGDDIIMQCVKEELKDIICNYFTLSIPTHLCAFNTLDV